MFYLADDYLLTDVLCPDSDLLNSISTLLNKKSPGVKNWKILAYKLGVPNEVYDEFEENLPKKSPTKMMLKWLNSERPGLTVEQLRTALKEIGRADALEILDGYLSQQGNLQLKLYQGISKKKMIMIMTTMTRLRITMVFIEDVPCFVVIVTLTKVQGDLTDNECLLGCAPLLSYQ